MKIEYMKVVGFQEEDSCSEINEDQSIAIETHDAGAGIYYTIETKRWGFSSIEELTNHLESMMTAAIKNMKEE